MGKPSAELPVSQSKKVYHFTPLTTEYSRRVGGTVTGRGHDLRLHREAYLTVWTPGCNDGDTMTLVLPSPWPPTRHPYPVPTQLPTPSEMRSMVVSTWASLVPCAVVAPVPSSMDSTGLVRRIRECMAYQAAPTALAGGRGR